MGMTLTEKILAHGAGKKSVSPGDVVWVSADALMTHDVCGPPTAQIFGREFGADACVWDRQKVYVIPDHYIHTDDERAARNIGLIRDFSKSKGLIHFFDPDTDAYRGVCHITLAEERIVRPGQILLGTDSHTCTAGAFGAFATGIGNSDAAFVLSSGKLWMKVPHTIHIVLNGALHPGVMAKDVILKIIHDIGVNGATYGAIEFSGSCIDAMSIEERMTLCNMVIEAGAKNGICPADSVVEAFFREKGISVHAEERSDASAVFAQTLEYDAEKFEPMVARPHSPGNGATAQQAAGTPIDRAYIGSCTGGKTEDFIAAAEVLFDKQVAVKTFGVPATKRVEQNIKERQIQDSTVWDILVNAGVHMGPPSCAACLGGPADTFGRVNEPITVVSTTNRNFPGRMGHPDANIFLASPRTVAASALSGMISTE